MAWDESNYEFELLRLTSPIELSANSILAYHLVHLMRNLDDGLPPAMISFPVISHASRVYCQEYPSLIQRSRIR